MHLHRLERMKAIVQQAVAEGKGGALREVHLVSYGDVDAETISSLFVEASEGTPAAGVAVRVHAAGSRFICWNCCGLRFESADGMCPNCGDVGLEVPDDIDFSLRKVVMAS